MKDSTYKEIVITIYKILYGLAALLLICCMFFSCTVKSIDKHSTDYYVNGDRIYEFKYDSCEYIHIGGHNSQAISHKGNCKNCLKRK